jgi:putative CRISPR-associated protein (TIGR02619 family)
MAKTIISATGTSANRILKLKFHEFQPWVKSRSSLEQAAQELFQAFSEIAPEGDALKNTLSAEIHSLVRIGLEPSDRVILLSSDTDDGYCCTLAVKFYLERYFPSLIVQEERIRGLQVDDTQVFRTTGVVGFVKNITDAISAYGADNVILNPTAGFKALVPYTVLVGMLKGVKCEYIFEQSTTLLELPPLPIEFSRTQFEFCRLLLERIDRESSIAWQDWQNEISFEQQKWFAPLIERLGNDVTLSAIGFLFLEEMRRPSALVPFLSQKAIEDCFRRVDTLDNRDPFMFLERVARSEQAFEQANHKNVGNGLYWLKPGAHTTDRYLVSRESWRLLVWRVIREDQEGSKYINTVQVDPNLDRGKYAPFMRMDFIR